MTERILGVLFVFISKIIATTGYAGIAILMAIESACIPLPSELIMPFAGYLVHQGTFKLLWAATAGAIGCNLGSLVAYEIGCYGGRPLVERYGRWILMGRRVARRLPCCYTRQRQEKPAGKVGRVWKVGRVRKEGAQSAPSRPGGAVTTDH